MTVRPPFCQLCASEDRTEVSEADDGRAFFICNDRSHGDDPFVWEPAPPPTRSQRGDGLGAELGIWDKLLECVPQSAEFHSYGDVEDEFFDRFPADAAVLMKQYGHKWRDPAFPSNQYSMSAYLASRLRELSNEGLLELAWRPGTGEWVHNVVISHWRLKLAK